MAVGLRRRLLLIAVVSHCLPGWVGPSLGRMIFTQIRGPRGFPSRGRSPIGPGGRGQARSTACPRARGLIASGACREVSSLSARRRHALGAGSGAAGPGRRRLGSAPIRMAEPTTSYVSTKSGLASYVNVWLSALVVALACLGLGKRWWRFIARSSPRFFPREGVPYLSGHPVAQAPPRRAAPAWSRWSAPLDERPGPGRRWLPPGVRWLPRRASLSRPGPGLAALAAGGLPRCRVGEPARRRRCPLEQQFDLRARSTVFVCRPR